MGNIDSIQDNNTFPVGKKCAGIYLLINKITNKAYVGKSKTGIIHRIKQHIRDLNAGRHVNSAMQVDYNTHGLSSFAWQVLEDSYYLENAEEINFLEYAWYMSYSQTNIMYNSISILSKKNIQKWEKLIEFRDKAESMDAFIESLDIQEIYPDYYIDDMWYAQDNGVYHDDLG